MAESRKWGNLYWHGLIQFLFLWQAVEIWRISQLSPVPSRLEMRPTPLWVLWSKAPSLTCSNWSSSQETASRMLSPASASKRRMALFCQWLILMPSWKQFISHLSEMSLKTWGIDSHTYQSLRSSQRLQPETFQRMVTRRQPRWRPSGDILGCQPLGSKWSDSRSESLSWPMTRPRQWLLTRPWSWLPAIWQTHTQMPGSWLP